MSAEEQKVDAAENAAENAEAQTATAEKPKEKKVRTPRIKTVNCSSCNKLLRKGWWYYRDSKYFCNKRCWKTAKDKKSDE